METKRLATRKQCYAIYCLLHRDVRNDNLTIDEASEIIANALADKKKTSNSSVSNRKSLRNEFIDFFRNNMKEVVRYADEEFKIKSIISNDNLYMKEKKSYVMIGGSLGIVWFNYRKNNKLAQEIAELYCELCGRYDSTCFLNMFLSYYGKEAIRYYEKIGCPLQALFHQNLKIQIHLHDLAVRFAAERGVKMSIDYNDD